MTISAINARSTVLITTQPSFDQLSEKTLAVIDELVFNRLFDKNTSFEVRKKLARRSAKLFCAPRHNTFLLTKLQSLDDETRAIAAISLGFKNNIMAFFALRSALADSNQAVKEYSLLSISHLLGSRIDTAVRKLLLDIASNAENHSLRLIALRSLTYFLNEETKQLFLSLVSSPCEDIQLAALNGLFFQCDQRSLEFIRPLLYSSNELVRKKTHAIFARFGFFAAALG